MKFTGIARAMDKLGRIVIPKELRKGLELKPGDELEIFTANGGLIVLRKAVAGCFFCGARRGLVRYKNIDVCDTCARSVGKLGYTK